ncbi:MAG: hypothetical protein EAZ55_10130 [Cytophagales bacterium]|nr:MAG: hypothetical protein EAZ55_10130 [Cytophagales bacterium]
MRSFFFCFLWSLVGMGQTAGQGFPIEVPIDLQESMALVPIEEEGFALIDYSEMQKTQRFSCTLYDTLGQVYWQTTLAVQKGLYFGYSTVVGKQIYLLFYSYYEDDYQVFKINNKGFVEQSTFHYIRNFDVKNFAADKQGVYLLGYLREKPMSLYYHWKQAQTTILPIQIEGEVYFRTLVEEWQQNRLNIVLYQKEKNRKSNLIVKVLSEGKVIESHTLQDERFYLLDGIAIYDSLQKQTVLLALFSPQDWYLPKGFLVAKWQNTQDNRSELVCMQKKNFGELDGFFDYIHSEKQRTRYRQKVLKREARKTGFFFGFEAISTQFTQQGGNYWLLTDFAYPLHWSYHALLPEYTYNYSHALLLEIEGSNCEIKNSYPLIVSTRDRFVTRSELQPLSVFQLQKDSVQMAFIDGYYWYSKHIRRGANDVSKESTAKKDTLSDLETDNVAFVPNFIAKKWYKGHYLLYGHRKLRNGKDIIWIDKKRW